MDSLPALLNKVPSGKLNRASGNDKYRAKILKDVE
jgi:hypothetical protein